MLTPGTTDALILCGGEGKRLRAVVGDRPKPLASVGDRPFLDILVGHFARWGFGRFVFLVGYKAGMIVEHMKGVQPQGVEFVFSLEAEPLGTGGAVRNAAPHLRSGVLMIANGDSFCPLDMRAFMDFHERKRALVSVALAAPPKETDYGAVVVDGEGRILEFAEKGEARGHVSAGIYLFDRQVVDTIPGGRFYSIEHDLFPSMLPSGRVYGFISQAGLLDIGTPERYARALREGLPGLGQ